jgi:DNA-binding NarL/FixJ family response regulator
LPINILSVNSIQDLFPLLSSPSYYTDFIVIDEEILYKDTNGLDVFDILNTLNILIKSTVYRLSSSIKPVKRDTKIIVLITRKTEPKIIKELMTFGCISSIVLKIENESQLQDSIEQLNKILSGDFTISKEVMCLIKPKIKKQNKPEISLTTRQTQVMHLLTDRGLSNKLIAKTLNITESTVKLHISSMLKKFGAKNRTQLVAFAKNT